MYEAVVMGASAGGLQALKTILSDLPALFPIPIMIVQHIGERSDSFMADYLNAACDLTVKEAEDKEPLLPRHVYIAPSGYHLLVEPDRTLSLSVDPRINYSCPAIDVLFESAAETYRETLIGVVLTGANSDGAQGLKTIKSYGGLAIVQNPETSEASTMPRMAMQQSQVDYVAELTEIAPLLMCLVLPEEEEFYGTDG